MPLAWLNTRTISLYTLGCWHQQPLKCQHITDRSFKNTEDGTNLFWLEKNKQTQGASVLIVANRPGITICQSTTECPGAAGLTSNKLPSGSMIHFPIGNTLKLIFHVLPWSSYIFTGPPQSHNSFLFKNGEVTGKETWRASQYVSLGWLSQAVAVNKNVLLVN